MRNKLWLAMAMLLTVPGLAFGQEVPHVDTGTTAWMLISTGLVLLMIPGLAMFYGGLVRTKNVLGTMMHTFVALAIIGVLWTVCGYSLTFGHSILGGFLGWNKDYVLLMGIDSAVSNGVPEYVIAMFQGKFAIITPALIAGAFAERIKFSASVLFFTLWHLIVYAPICHQVWGGGWLGGIGVLDFAGGAVVHVNSGVAGLVCAIVLGRRKGYGVEPILAHNPVLTMIGASLLLVGWIGFNAGSAGAANDLMGVALLNTLLAAAAAALTWKIVEYIEKKKVSLIGMLSGVVAGLVAITPAAGTAGPMGALVIGLASGVICFFCATSLKRKLGYDDSLDAFGVHGIGGIVGAILTGVFAAPVLGGFGTVEDIGAQVWIQIVGVLVTVVYTGIVTFVILKVLDLVMGLRVSEESETVGLDLSEHNERGYNL